MKLEDQVCGLDLAKRLKELGVRQESAFWWADLPLDSMMHGDDGHEHKWTLIFHDQRLELRRHDEVAAFTVAELGELLPDFVTGNKISSKDGSVQWSELYDVPSDAESYEPPIEKYAPTEADARAKMLVYLIEQGIVKAQD